MANLSGEKERVTQEMVALLLEINLQHDLISASAACASLSFNKGLFLCLSCV